METAREKGLGLFLCFYCTAGIHRSEAACYFAGECLVRSNGADHVGHMALCREVWYRTCGG
eukprot:5284422-Amphidinium_carterae.1